MVTNKKWEHQKHWSLKQYSPRPEQERIINEIIDAIDMGFKNIIIEAGTGTGKSAIATTIANYVGDSYILTMTKQLQNQYLTDFNYMLAEIKGTSNYSCNLHSTSCDDCSMIEQDKSRHKECKYKQALEYAKSHSCVITNYDYLFYSGNYAESFGKRKLLVLDECHNLEKKIMQLIGKTLNRQKLFKRYGFDIFYPITNGGTLKSIDNTDYWISTLYKLYDYAKNNQLNAPNRKSRELYRNDKEKFDYLIRQLEDSEAKFIIELPSKKDILKDKLTNGKFKNGLKAEFKPLTINDYSNQLLHFGEVRLFMTGTLGSKDKFCEWIGIESNETYYIHVKSPFLKSNRRIIKSYTGSMSNNRWNNQVAIDQIKKIISKHRDEKGVIHTSSNQQAWWIKKNLNSNKVWVAYGANREETIQQFEESNYPIVLVGAGIKDGVDFKGDKCRFQILFKVPYPSLGGKQVNIRMHYDNVWYMYQTIMPLMQAYGRGVRDMDDYCTMYVLDEDFDKLLYNYQYLFNEYFLEAVEDFRKPVCRPVRVGDGL